MCDDDEDNDQYENDDKGGPVTALPSSTWRGPVRGEGLFICFAFYDITDHHKRSFHLHIHGHHQ